MKVMSLVPGMKVNMPLGKQATFIAKTDHPLYQGLALVIWKMPKGDPMGDWSHDALSWQQDVGEVVPATPYERRENLIAALLGGA